MFLFFFFFKQKTAYEMRISDWSSDVCSSDLSGKPASKTLSLFKPLPQLLKNVRFAKGKPLESEGVRQAISAAETRLNGTGRLVIRKSGTEPLIRVMAEGERSEEHTSELQSIMRSSYAVCCCKKQKNRSR